MKVEKLSYDVAVFGSGSGGLLAAVAAARLGVKVLLVEREGFLGGMMASGIPILGFLDIKHRQITSGLAEEVVDRLVARGGSYGITVDPHHNSLVTVQPADMRVVAIEMVREAGVDVIMHCDTVDAKVEGGVLKTVSIFGKGTRFDIDAKVFIDGTGDGDVGYLAGAQFEKGQKGTGALQPPTMLCSIGNVKFDRMWDYLDKHPEDHVDPVEWYRKEPSFAFVGFKTLYQRLKEEGKRPPINIPALICCSSMNEGQVFINGNRLSGTDASDIISLTKGEMDGQVLVPELVKMLKENVPGFEDCYLLYTNPSLGIRETRRFVGKKMVMVESAQNYEIPDDTIALAGYMIDIHSAVDDKSTFIKLDGPFGIPYQCLVSKNIDGLMMAGRCISVDARVYGSTRVMATCMNVGEAAGIGAALAVKQGISPADVSSDEVRGYLKKSGNILSI